MYRLEAVQPRGKNSFTPLKSTCKNRFHNLLLKKPRSCQSKTSNMRFWSAKPVISYIYVWLTKACTTLIMSGIALCRIINNFNIFLLRSQVWSHLVNISKNIGYSFYIKSHQTATIIFASQNKLHCHIENHKKRITSNSVNEMVSPKI